MADLAETPGKLLKIMWALGTFPAAWNIASLLGNEAQATAGSDPRDAFFRTLAITSLRGGTETVAQLDEVAKLTVQLARALHLHEDDVQALRWGAYVHDVGKTFLPESVLMKRRPLDASEYKLLIQHTKTGCDLVSQLLDVPQGTLDVVLHHHERYDGQGYPAGLKGDDIPIHARVFTIVDVYDALTTARVYKSAWSHEDALLHIKAETGQMFDSRVAEAFLKVVRNKGDV